MPDDDNLLQFLDDDLWAELEEFKHGPGANIMRDIILEKQRKRQARREMTPVKRRRDIARETLKADLLKDADRYHIHSVLAMCGLPYRRPDDGAVEYIQRYGKNSLVVTAGRLQDPESGLMVRPGLPYGPKARLMMLHICTEALRSGSPEIHVGDSMSAFIKDLGFPVSGGKNGTINLFKEQINRLAAAHMTLGLWDGEVGHTLNSKPIEEFSIWFPKDPNQRVLWPSRLVLEQKFFLSLKRHALPVDIRVLRTFANSARQIDIILWLAYRLKQVNRPYLLTWDTLRDQFGSDIAQAFKFKQSFKADFAAINEVFPKLPAKLGEKGLQLFPADPKDLFVQPKQAKPKQIRKI